MKALVRRTNLFINHFFVFAGKVAIRFGNWFFYGLWPLRLCKSPATIFLSNNHGHFGHNLCRRLKLILAEYIRPIFPGARPLNNKSLNYFFGWFEILQHTKHRIIIVNGCQNWSFRRENLTLLKNLHCEDFLNYFILFLRVFVTRK